MGNILEFRRGEDAAARIAKPVDGSLGQIIIFPGVRIDRRTSTDISVRTANVLLK